MTRKEKAVLQFVETTRLKSMDTVNQEGGIKTHIDILVEDENGQFKTILQNLPDMPVGDDFESFIKAVVMKGVIDAYLKSLKRKNYTFIHLVHSELITFDDGDQTLLILQKDDKGNSISNMYDVIRNKVSNINEDGKLVFGNAEFVERQMKKGT